MGYEPVSLFNMRLLWDLCDSERCPIWVNVITVLAWVFLLLYPGQTISKYWYAFAGFSITVNLDYIFKKWEA